MYGGSPLRSAPGADRSGHGDAEPAGSSHRLSRVFNVYICSARLPPCACSLACYSSNGIFQPQSTSRPPTVPAHTPAPACTPRCFGYRNHTPESPALPMQSPAVSRSRHLTVCDGVSVCGHASVSGRHASGLCIEYSFPIDTPPVGPQFVCLHSLSSATNKRSQERLRVLFRVKRISPLVKCTLPAYTTSATVYDKRQTYSIRL